MEPWELAAREGVRHTLAMYNHAGDRGRIDDLAACFTADGELHIGDEPPVIGRAAIVERLADIVPGERRPTHLHHHVASVRFPTVTPTEVVAASYFQVLTDVGLDHWGRYHDVLEPDGDRWLIARRQVITTGYGPDSYFRRA